MNLSRAKRAGLAGLLAIAAIGVVAVWSYLSPWAALSAAERALEAGDQAYLGRAVDWRGVREKLIVALATDALRSSGLSSGDERATTVILAVENTVDRLVTPGNLATTLAQAKGRDKLVVKGGYLNMGVFVFAIENVATKSAVSLRMRRAGPGSWVIDEVIMLDPKLLAAPAGG